MELSLTFYLTVYAISFILLFVGILLLVVSSTKEVVREGTVMHVSPRPQFSDYMVVVSFMDGSQQQAFYFTTADPSKYRVGATVQWKNRATTGVTIAGTILVSISTFAILSTAVLHIVQVWGPSSPSSPSLPSSPSSPYAYSSYGKYANGQSTTANTRVTNTK